MRFLEHGKTKRLKVLLISIIFVILGIIIAVFAGYRHVLDKPETLISLVQDEANIAMHRIRQTATRDGLREWSLEAESGRFVESRQEAILENLSVTFFMENDNEIYLTADQGILRTDTNNIEVRGNVIVRNQSLRLETEKLRYDHGKRAFSSDLPVKIIDNSFKLMADSLVFDLNTNKALLEGNVKGAFSEDFDW